MRGRKFSAALVGTTRRSHEILDRPLLWATGFIGNFAEAYIRDMGRQFSHLLGTTGMLLTMLLWLSLLKPQKADHFVDSLAGSQHEYKIVLGATLLSTVFSFIAAIRGSKWWYVGLAFSSATLAFFTYSLSA
jgi:spore maturation protein SpmA